MPSIELRLSQTIYHPGQVVEGHVFLHHRLLQEEGVSTVTVEHKGALKIHYEQNDSERTEKIELYHNTLCVWNQGQAALSSSGSSSIPFNFTLPTELPPSCDIQANYKTGIKVEYKVKVVGKRLGLLRRDKRVEKSLTVRVRPIDPHAEVQLQNGWDGPWTTAMTSKRVRQRLLWGSRAELKVVFTFPAITLPALVRVPFTLSAITISDPCPEGSERELWAKPPHESQNVKLELISTARVHLTGARAVDLDESIKIPLLLHHPEVEQKEKEWESLGDGMGRWRQKCISVVFPAVMPAHVQLRSQATSASLR